MQNVIMITLRTLAKLILALTIPSFVLVLGIAIFLFWASRGYDRHHTAPPPLVEESLVEPNRGMETTDTIVVLTYNIANGRGPALDVFIPRTREETERYLDELGVFLRAADADIVALQEVDFDAHRTHHTDQVDWLAHTAGYPYQARVTTWRANYVPFPFWPPSRQIGRIHSGQAVLSRYPMMENHRIELPQPDTNPWWYNLFYLHRVLQRVTVQVENQPLIVFNCHLEAFDVANREQQARIVAEEVIRQGDRPWIVMGDMNSPPPEAPQRGGFSDNPDWDATRDGTVEILRRGLGALEVPGLETYRTDHTSTFTFPAGAPTRRLDYIFSSPDLPAQTARVAVEAGSLSDHLPLVATFRWPPQGRPVQLNLQENH